LHAQIKEALEHLQFISYYIRKRASGILAVFFLLSSAGLWSQVINLGFPPVFNYKKDVYKAGSQNWDIVYDPTGYVWFANNGGILQFNGYQWTTYKIPNETIVRSLALGENGYLYVGGQGSFGYLAPNHKGEYQFVNLSQRLRAEDANFEDVWDVINYDGVIFFRTDDNVFGFVNGTLKSVWSSRKKLNYLGVWKSELVLQDTDNNLYSYDKNGFLPRKGVNSFDKGRISGAVNIQNDTVLITTISNGIFYVSDTGILPWPTSNDALLKNSIIFCADSGPAGSIVLGTSFNGLMVIDKYHRIQDVVQKKNGLQNNSVLSIRCTPAGNIWLGLDNGIDLVELLSPVRTLYPDGELQGTGYAIASHQGRLYFGTNTGLYTLPLKSFYSPSEKIAFERVANSQGQVWNLTSSRGKLMMGHHDGAFSINGTKAQLQLKHNGIWNFVSLDADHVVSGYYTGFQLWTTAKNQWEAVEGFKESSRIVYQQANTLWMAHPYRGIFSFSIDEMLHKKLTKGLKPMVFPRPNIKPMLYKARDLLWVTDQSQLFQVLDNGQLQADTILTRYLALDNGLKFMMEDEFKNIWFNNGKETGMLVPEKSFEPLYKKYVIRNLTGRFNEGFPSVVTLDPNNVAIPSEKGFIFFDALSFTRREKAPHLFLTEVVLTLDGKDSTVWKAYAGGKLPDLSLPADENNLTFSFSQKDAADQSLMEYSHKLEDVDKSWSAWDKDPNIALQRLSPGTYTLLIKARYDSALESPEIKIIFKIRRPWYLSIWAYFIYLGMLIGAVYYFVNRQKRKHLEAIRWMEQERVLREKEHQLESEIAKEEIIKLQNENLKSELEFKNQELTSFTYHLVNKNELINEIKSALQKLEKKFQDQAELKKEIKSVYKLTEQNSNIDEDWENFVQSFDQVHANFFKRLTDEFGDLSPNDYKMCTYLRMNLTSKEIASLMNISIRSVETNRYRLRKKLDLDPETNLVQFLMKY
jgi:DNA-binding CsgD family transcriptional regulator